MSPQDVEDLVLYQVSALAGIARSEGVRLQHVKPHGALYNMACRDEALAEAIARAVVACDPTLVLFGLPDSALIQAGLDAGLPVAAEAFADRAYHADGSLVSRSAPGSVIHDVDIGGRPRRGDGLRALGRHRRRHAHLLRGRHAVRARRHPGRGAAGGGDPARSRRCRRDGRATDASTGRGPPRRSQHRPGRRRRRTCKPRIKLVWPSPADRARSACFSAGTKLVKAGGVASSVVCGLVP